MRRRRSQVVEFGRKASCRVAASPYPAYVRIVGPVSAAPPGLPLLPSIPTAIEPLHHLRQHHVTREDRHQPWEVAQR
ncbi:hypothetical protein DD605_07590 [Enterobacter cloacae complex sp. 3DZ3S2B]|nr:hypothetical protein DD603_18765 [Enterobacter cloacae complex sp. 2DZ2F2B]RYA45470.1 hypothetical protein DD605_07590 [Enterobacter cloacae complex sp. 3DZ3S2B]